MTTLMIRTSLLLLWISNATCLAQTPHFSKVISTKKGTGLSKTYRILPEDITPGGILPSSSIQDKTKSNDGLISQVSAGIRSTFLPSGYPKSTPPGYLQYSIWSWIQDLSSQLRSVLATQRVLEGVGVGRQGATALSALLNFLVRDGCGMGANLLFTSLASSSFSTDGKRWRIFADIMVDIGLTLEVCATMVPGNWFLPMICAGNMCKAICGVAAGAVGGVFNLHWAQGSDIADIQAKFGAQHTVTGSLGLLCAYQFVQTVAQVDPTNLWVLYGVLTVLHLYANMRCMKIIAFDYLNTPRMRMVIQQFLEQWNNGQAETLSLMDPKVLARKEPLLFGVTSRRKPTSSRILFGESFERHRKLSDGNTRATHQLLGSLSESIGDQKYLISASSSSSRKNRLVVVSLAVDATPRHKAKAYLHAVLLGRALQDSQPELVATVQLESAWHSFERACQQGGWDLEKTQLHTRGYELSLVE